MQGNDAATTSALPLERYLELARQSPDLFASPPGGVTIELDRARISEIEQAVAAQHARSGIPASWSAVGLMYEDPYIFILRDAVVFLDGTVGVHHRIIHRAGVPSGVAMLSFHDARIVLLRHFRHATRAWHLEAPRGAIKPGQTTDEAVIDELREEIGAEVASLIELGTIHGATELVSAGVACFVVQLRSIGAPALGEGIAEIVTLTIPELERAIADGDITDAFTIGTFARARLRGLV